MFLRTAPHTSASVLGTGRSVVRLSTGSYDDVVDWHCSLPTRCVLCWRAAGTIQNAKQNELNDARPLYNLSHGATGSL